MESLNYTKVIHILILILLQFLILLANYVFSIKKSTLAKRDRREKEDTKKQKKSLIQQRLWNYLIRLNKKLSMIYLRSYNIRKKTHPYVELQVKDAQTIGTETQTTNSELLKLKQEFYRINNFATEQKSQTDAINLIYDIVDEDNLFRKIDTEDIWIEDG